VNFIGEVQQPVPPSAINEITPSELMRQMMDGFISLKAMDAEEKKLERENESYRMLLREYREGILLFSIMESEVWKKASADTAGQRLYYNANSFKYRAGERIRARLLSVADSLTAESFLERHNKGDSITSADLRKFRTVTPFRNYEKGENKIIDKVVWMPGLYRTEDRSVIWLVEIKRLIPPGLKTLQEARASVISDYQDEVEKKWLLELRKQFPVSVDEKAKKMIFKRLSAPEGSGKQNRKL
jgi:peptidyl-prolyl cis-trans isomerase SurA